MLIAETIRQVGALLAHVKFDVPLGYHFLMWELSYSAARDTLAAGRLPTDLTLRAHCQEVARRGKRLSALRYTAEIWRGATRIATGSAAYNCTSPAVYKRLRGDLPEHADIPLAPPIEPRLVGRADSGHVVLADPAADPAFGPAGTPTGGSAAALSADPAGLRQSPTRRTGRWPLRVDTEHPVFFDHPQDHVPGMLLLEAARQATQALLGPAPVQPFAASSTFERYAELTVPTWIEAEAGQPDAEGNTPVTITGHQDDRPLFAATMIACPLT